MSIYAVTQHQVLHTCPADPEPHPIATTQTVVHVTPGRTCLTPVTIRIGNTTRTVSCGRRLPYERQCGSCRTIVTVRSVTTTDLGYQGPAHLAPATEDAA